MSTKRSYTAGQFQFVLDGEPANAFIRSVSGGNVKGKLVQDSFGPNQAPHKHLGAIDIEPFSIEIGTAMAYPVLDWIRDSWKRAFTRKNGTIIHADGDFNIQFEQEFQQALITETTFPALDGSTKESAYLKVAFHPEIVKNHASSGNRKLNVDKQSAKQKLWSPCNFRVEIDGIDCSMINKVDAISVKQTVKPLHTGRSRQPELEPTGLEFGNLTVYMALAYARDFMAWHREYVVEGAKEYTQERTGAIVYLGPDGTDLFRINLYEIGISGFSIVDSKAGAAEIKRCKIEMYVERMTLDYGYGVG